MASKRKSPIEKTLLILKNEGPVSVAKKSIKVAKNRVSKIQHKRFEAVYPNLLERYRYLENPIFQIDAAAIEASTSAKGAVTKPTSMLWFVPFFDHVAYGGIYTIFRFMESFAKNGVQPTIVIYDNPYIDADEMRSEVTEHFPGLKDCEIIIFDVQKDKVEDLPARDIAFATIWMSAYLLLRYNQTKHKYYFVQDYEPLFYEGGSMYAIAESTYRFGFTGIVNTPGLLNAVQERHDMKGISFRPAVDASSYYPPKQKRSNRRTKVFFYARPGNPRNAFELCILIIEQLLAKHGDDIEIVTAGADWNEGAFNLRGKITNLGLIDGIEQVAELYRSCDIGCVYMLSKHPSYQPFEFMASGMATVTNRNEDNMWFLDDGNNCLVSEPSPAAMAEKISLLIEDKALRERISKNGRASVGTDWGVETKKVWNYICKRKED